MTQMIKKYRRKVSNERVERAAEALYLARNMQWMTGKSLKEWEASRDRGSASFLWDARIVLEADAEVIEAERRDHHVSGAVFLLIDGILFGYFSSEEEFNTEWEEIR